MKRAHNRVNMIGKTYNSWEVLEWSHTKDKTAYYSARCIECNTVVVVDGRNIRLGLSKRCIGCGHAVTAARQAGKMRKGIEPKLAAYRILYSRYKKGAKSRGFSFQLSLKHFVCLVKKTCHYCGIPPNTVSNPLIGSGYSEEKLSLSEIIYNGVDRIDSDNGYSVENCVTCCEICNKAKRDLPLGTFLAWLSRAANYQTSKNIAAAPIGGASD